MADTTIIWKELVCTNSGIPRQHDACIGRYPFVLCVIGLRTCKTVGAKSRINSAHGTNTLIFKRVPSCERLSGDMMRPYTVLPNTSSYEINDPEARNILNREIYAAVAHSGKAKCPGSASFQLIASIMDKINELFVSL